MWVSVIVWDTRKYIWTCSVSLPADRKTVMLILMLIPGIQACKQFWIPIILYISHWFSQSDPMATVPWSELYIAMVRNYLVADESTNAVVPQVSSTTYFSSVGPVLWMNELVLMILISLLSSQSPRHPNTFCKLLTSVRLSWYWSWNVSFSIYCSSHRKQPSRFSHKYSGYNLGWSLRSMQFSPAVSFFTFVPGQKKPLFGQMDWRN